MTYSYSSKQLFKLIHDCTKTEDMTSTICVSNIAYFLSLVLIQISGTDFDRYLGNDVLERVPCYKILILFRLIFSILYKWRSDRGIFSPFWRLRGLLSVFLRSFSKIKGVCGISGQRHKFLKDVSVCKNYIQQTAYKL